MRILKYIFYILLLLLTALSVYVFTQDGSYLVNEKKVIQLPVSTLFNYVNDYKNWNEFNASFVKDSTTKTEFSKVAIGVGATMDWKNKNSNGTIKTIFTTNDSIAQRVDWMGNPLKSYWLFKETTKGTEVTWTVSGTLNFKAKLFKLFSSGVDSEIQSTIKASLENLNQLLIKEINDHSITINGIQTVNEVYYLQQKSTCKIPDFYTKVFEILPKMQLFFEENSIGINGHPMVIFDSYDVPKNKVTFNICLPISEEIFTSPESEITGGKREIHQALKITLKGDYSHSKKAWDKGFEYIKVNNLQESDTGSYMEIYVKNSSQSHRPSEWITEIYIPVKTKNSSNAIVVQNPSTADE
jgi:effector-binding domain-containing protein/ribosome-associated toxin RatA of RatAB toxin-antitoxin module